jgi:hypothetical protein
MAKAKPKAKVTSKVDHPAHYNQGSIECIDAIESALGPAGALAFCQGNVLKYVWRAGLKDGEKTVHDFNKAQWYLKRGIEIVERASGND